MYEFSGLTGEWQLARMAPIYCVNDRVKLLVDTPQFPAGTVGTVVGVFDPPYPEAYDYDSFIEVVFGEPDEEGLVWCYKFWVLDEKCRSPGMYLEIDLDYVSKAVGGLNGYGR
jgi:hypothetical protein